MRLLYKTLIVAAGAVSALPVLAEPFGASISNIASPGINVDNVGTYSQTAKMQRIAQILGHVLTKRDDAAAAVDPTCYEAGQPCDLIRIQAAWMLKELANAYVAAKPHATADDKNTSDNVEASSLPLQPRTLEVQKQEPALFQDEGTWVNDEHGKLLSCYGHDGPCLGARTPEPDPNPDGVQEVNNFVDWLEAIAALGGSVDFGDVPHTCVRVGQPCIKIKRAASLIMDLEDLDADGDGVAKHVDDHQRRSLDLDKDNNGNVQRSADPSKAKAAEALAKLKRNAAQLALVD